MKPSPRLGLGACLVLLVIVPQATLGAFIPAVPQVASELGVSVAAIDRTLILYMAGYAGSLLATGMLAARIGLRRTQFGALVLYVGACGALALAPTIETLSIARVLQALGAGAGTVLARIYVHEALPQGQQLRALTRLSTAIALTPAVAPPLAGLILVGFSWRLIACALGALGVSVLLLARHTMSAQSPPAADERDNNVHGGLHHRSYWWYTAAISLAWCAYFAFTTFSSHALQIRLGVTSASFGLLYAVVVAGYVVGSVAARRLATRWDLHQLLARAGLLSALGATVMVISTKTAPHQPLAVVLPMTLTMIGIGATFPLCQAGMLRSTGTHARSASGPFFFIQMASGALYTAAISTLDPTTPELLAIAVFAPTVALAGLIGLRRTWIRADPVALHRTTDSLFPHRA
jgi:DHA1 family bicyclomycin/chloramphenicol resistance-like MFS transporter